jgi:hypothetical protein
MELLRANAQLKERCIIFRLSTSVFNNMKPVTPKPIQKSIPILPIVFYDVVGLSSLVVRIQAVNALFVKRSFTEATIRLH